MQRNDQKSKIYDFTHLPLIYTIECTGKCTWAYIVQAIRVKDWPKNRAFWCKRTKFGTQVDFLILINFRMGATWKAPPGRPPSWISKWPPGAPYHHHLFAHNFGSNADTKLIQVATWVFRDGQLDGTIPNDVMASIRWSTVWRRACVGHLEIQYGGHVTSLGMVPSDWPSLKT